VFTIRSFQSATLGRAAASRSRNRQAAVFRAIARVAFKDNPEFATKLVLGGKRKESLSGWLLQAQRFYANTLDNVDIHSALAPYGVTMEKLQAGQAEVEAVEGAGKRQKAEMSEAQIATQERDTALDALDDWMADFRELARIAVEDNPQLLEMLDIRQSS